MNFSRVWRCTPALAGVLLCALLTACATPQVTQLQAAANHPATGPANGEENGEALARQADLPSVPFFAQQEYECGPAALAMLLAASGVAVTPEELVEQVYLPARKGSLQVEMLAATRQRARLAYPLQPQLRDVLLEVAAGHPVLVFQNVSLPIYPVWHYAVVVGYDLDANRITLHSGETERMQMSLFTFERLWARGHYWAMLALAPDQLPATADLQTLARSLAALEGNQPEAARLAYGAALARWPQQGVLLFGLGNSRYALQDLAGAQAAYLEATGAQPDFADAWNNLAQTDLELGQPASAAAAIARAVALGGPRLAQYLQLQAQIGQVLHE